MIHGVNGGEQPDFSKRADEIAAEIDMLDGKANDTVNFDKISGDKLTIWEKYAEEYGLEHAPGQKKISIKDIRAKILEALQLKDLQRQEDELEAQKDKEEIKLEFASQFKDVDESEMTSHELPSRSRDDMEDSVDIEAHREEAEELVLKELGTCDESSATQSVTVRTKDGNYYTITAVPVKKAATVYYRDNMAPSSRPTTQYEYHWDLDSMQKVKKADSVRIKGEFGLV